MSQANSVKHLLFFLIVGTLGLVLFIMFYPPYDDFSSLKLTVDQSAAIEKSKILARKLNIDVTDKDPSVSLHRQNKLLEDHQKKYGLKETAKKINENLPGYYWSINYSDLKESSDSVSTVSVADDNQKSLQFEISTTGQLISIDNQLADSRNSNEFGNSHEESSRYIAGFSEAMDNSRQEFGEDRLLKVIKTSMEKSASEILEDVQEKVKLFTGDTPQHDDMTMVVVRVADLLLTNSNS